MADNDDDMVTIRAHHKKTGEVTIMRVKKGTPMGEVFKQYAEKKGLQEKSLSFARAGVRDLSGFGRPGKRGVPAPRRAREARARLDAPVEAGTRLDARRGCPRS